MRDVRPTNIARLPERSEAASPTSLRQGYGGPPELQRRRKPPSESERGWRPGSTQGSTESAGTRKLSYKEQRELESLPARIEAVEREQQELKREMESPDFYKAGGERIHFVMQRLDAVATELETLLERWMQLEERA
jgi:ABC transport system ATP-binding/permease protein